MTTSADDEAKAKAVAEAKDKAEKAKAAAVAAAAAAAEVVAAAEKAEAEANEQERLIIGLGIGGGAVLVLVGLGFPIINRENKQLKTNRLKQYSFNGNHALLMEKLKQHNMNDIGENMILTLNDIEKATNNFDTDRI
ncbi:hypothetical protein EJB05_15684, partial [Eragrostis curvula]